MSDNITTNHFIPTFQEVINLAARTTASAIADLTEYQRAVKESLRHAYDGTAQRIQELVELRSVLQQLAQDAKSAARDAAASAGNYRADGEIMAGVFSGAGGLFAGIFSKSGLGDFISAGGSGLGNAVNGGMGLHSTSSSQSESEQNATADQLTGMGAQLDSQIGRNVEQADGSLSDSTKLTRDQTDALVAMNAVGLSR